MPNDPLALVKLRTGARVFEVMVTAITISLKELLKANFVAFYEAVEVARNPGHRLFGNTGTVLCERGLLQEDGQMHDNIRAIILASVEGESIHLHLVDPVAH